MHGHTYSGRDIRSHVYLSYMHQTYMNEMYPCSRLHSCKQYVQEARDHLDQRYDAYTYLEFLSILVVEIHLRKQCQETQEYSTNQKGNRTQQYQDMENMQKIVFLKIDMSPRTFRTFSPRYEIDHPPPLNFSMEILGLDRVRKVNQMK